MADRLLRILAPGLLTTIQDLGRPGLMRYGVTPGGALDRAALVLGNRLVGNAPGAAGLELTLVGPGLAVAGGVVVALAGADLGARLNGAPLPLWRPVLLADGDEIAFPPGAPGTSGARAYLCLAGGIAVEPVMGSRSTDLFGGFGGWHGRALRAGDELPLGPAAAPPVALLRRRLAAPPPRHDTGAPVRVVLGPQVERFTDEGVAAFLGGEYAVSPKADRMGLRLTGPAVEHRRGADLVSEGIAHGAVQVPGDGRPIVLLGARQTIGGYPKIATAIGADLDGLGQRRPGDPVRFEAVDPERARVLTLEHLAGWGEAAVVADGRPRPGWAPPDRPGPESGGGDRMDGWDATGVARLIAALGEADVRVLRLDLIGGGLKLEVHRGADAAAPLPAAAPHATERDDGLVTAPLLGVFYRRSAPDQPPFAEEGDAVAAGQPIGLLEVMKTYHEVTAPRAGLLVAFLVEDGAYVEYGQAIARIEGGATTARRGDVP